MVLKAYVILIKCVHINELSNSFYNVKNKIHVYVSTNGHTKVAADPTRI